VDNADGDSGDSCREGDASRLSGEETSELVFSGDERGLLALLSECRLVSTLSFTNFTGDPFFEPLLLPPPKLLALLLLRIFPFCFSFQFSDAFEGA